MDIRDRFNQIDEIFNSSNELFSDKDKEFFTEEEMLSIEKESELFAKGMIATLVPEFEATSYEKKYYEKENKKIKDINKLE